MPFWPTLYVRSGVAYIAPTNSLQKRSACIAYHSSLGFDEGSVLSVDLVVKPARVAQVLACVVTSPQRGRRRAAIHALAAF